MSRGFVSRSATIFTRLINFCWSFFQWSLLLAVVAALVVAGYLYFRIDDEIRRHAERLLADHYRHLEVHVGRARFDQDHGIAIYDITFHGRGGDPSQPMLTIDEMYLAGKLGVDDLLASALCLERITIRRATLQAIRRDDGRWNVSTLLPLPHFSDTSPVIVIEDVTLVVDDGRRGTSPLWTMTGLGLTLTPAASDQDSPAATRRFDIAAIATGMTARELRVEGLVDADSGQLELAATAKGLELSGELLGMLPGAGAELNGADISGRADVALQISRPGAMQPLSWSAAITVDRGRLVHARLPAPLSDFTLTAHADTDRLRIERLEGKCGPASVVVAGERAGWAPHAPLALAARVVGLPLDERVRAVLPEACVRFWQRFEPAGIVDAEARITFDGEQWRPQLTVNCRGISLTDAERFPYRLEQTSGRIEYVCGKATRPDELRIDLTGIGGGQPVRIEGELRLGAGGWGLGAKQPATPAPVGWLQISGSDIPFHEQLIAALPEVSQRLVRALEPQGALDLHFRAEWTEAVPHDPDVTQEIRLKGCTLRYAEFPYPLRHVHGLITRHEGDWKIHDLEGRGANDATIVRCRGQATQRGEQWFVELALGAENVPLDENLKQALPPASRLVWDELRPQGRIDVSARAQLDTSQDKPVIELTLSPRERSVSVEAARFPYRLEQIEGVATYQASAVHVRNVRARHGRTEFSTAAGTCQVNPEGWQLSLSGVHVDRLALDRELLAALPAAWQRLVERFQPSGTLQLYDGNVSMAQRWSSPHLAAAWSVHVDCHRLGLRGELPLESVTGSVHLTGRSDGHSSHVAGEVGLDSVIWKDMQVTNVRGPVWLDARHVYLGEPASQRLGQGLRRITADAYGGSLTANAEIQHAGLPSYSLDVALGGASLARFANERPGGPKDVSGTVSGRLLLSGTGRSTHSLTGRGELHVVDANIYKLPVLVAMLKVLSNRMPNTTAFNRCDMQFTIQGEHIHFQHINLLGDAVNLYGKGESGFDRELDLVFYTLIEPASRIPFVKTVARQVSKQTLQLKVVGTWDEAEVVPQTLPGVSQVWEQIQTELQAGAATIAPATATRETATVPR